MHRIDVDLRDRIDLLETEKENYQKSLQDVESALGAKQKELLASEQNQNIQNQKS